MHELSKLHYAATKRILRYLQGTKNLSISSIINRSRIYHSYRCNL
ncbi:hypothetical protein CsSME_00016017 [Camellia sinensis var. sinensis]